MTPEELIASVRATLEQYEAELVPQPPPFITVQPSEDLAAAFATGLTVHLVAGQTYPGITLPSGARLVGNGAAVVGVGIPALYVAPGSSDIEASDLVCLSNVQGAVVQLGNNDTTQTTVAQCPSGIILTRVRVPTHRGKRAFEVNAADVVLVDCECHDVFTTTGQDSSGIGILNTPGRLSVVGGIFEAGSECVLFGGDSMKLTDIVGGPYISQATFDGCTFTRPPSWQTDGVLRVVKNLFEVKNGRGVSVLNCTLENCWKDGQDGYAFMLTPTRGGSVVNVTIENCTVRNVGGGINITAYDSHGISPVRTTGIRVVGGSFAISKLAYGGTGRFVLTTGGIGTLDVAGAQIAMDGSSFIYAAGGMVDRIGVYDSTFPAGSYGFNIAGGANASLWSSGCRDLEVTGNTISGAASALKTNLAAIGKTPANSYV